MRKSLRYFTFFVSAFFGSALVFSFQTQSHAVDAAAVEALSQEQRQASPPVIQSAIVQSAIASAHPLATQAGIDILKQGGNAFDAAIAVTATLAVVEPYSSGIGGGGFYLLHKQKNDEYVMLDAREVAPLQHKHKYHTQK